MTEQLVKVEKKENGTIAIVTMNKAPINALDTEFLLQIDKTFTDLATTDDKVRSVVFTGVENTFSAGLDLKKIPEYNPEEQKDLVVALNKLVGNLYSFPLPVVAALNGHAIAGGFVLLLTTDYRIGTRAEACKIGLTEVKVGIPFPIAALSVVKSELSPSVGRRMMLFGNKIDTEEAIQKRILDEVQAPDQVLPRAIDVAKEMAKLPKDSYGKIKQQLRSHSLKKINEVIESEQDPILGTWLNSETVQASLQALKKK